MSNWVFEFVGWLGEERHSRSKAQEEENSETQKLQELKNSEKTKSRFARVLKGWVNTQERVLKNVQEQPSSRQKSLFKQNNEKSKTKEACDPAGSRI